MWTHTGKVRTLKAEKTVRLKECQTVWKASDGRAYFKGTGKRPMDSSAGVVLLLNTIKPLETVKAM